jgi:thiamine biosynthesis protein ThiI
MEKVYLVHYGEIGLKGKNRSFFENQLVRNIRLALNDRGYAEVKRMYGRLLITLQPGADFPAIQERLSKTMGVVHFEAAFRIEQDIEAIKAAAVECLRDKQFSTLKVETKRSNKRFPLTSPEVNAEVGGHLLKNTGARADMRQPDVICNIEIADNFAFVYTDKIRGAGGLPVGVSGKALVMLSGGLDSPVAAWRMMKRGAKAIYVHFHSYPYTDKASLEKVEEIAQILAQWNYRSLIHFVPFGEVQREVVTKTPAPFRVILYRRMMTRIAQRIAQSVKAEALVTGESLGQVASQTLRNMRAIEEVAEMPILRPLIGHDKTEITALAQNIGTYEISTLPHDDCCSLFVPEHPATNPTLESVRKAEADLDVDALVETALGATERKIADCRL